MSTVPGHDSLRDAGLVDDPDEPVNLVESVQVPPAHAEPEEYRPGVARPDTEGDANEADVAEQASAVPALDDHDDA